MIKEVTSDGFIAKAQRDRVRENRVVQPNSDHRIALINMNFNNSPVVDLQNFDHVSYVATIDGEIYAEGEATYGIMDYGKVPLFGWYALLKMPNYQATMLITWSVGVQAANQTFNEKIDILTSATANTTISIIADGVV